jgi:hypothetical protein
MESLKLGPFSRLCLSNEGEHGLGEDRTLAVEAGRAHGNVAVGEEMSFDDGFEGDFGMPARHELESFKSSRTPNSRSMTNVSL